MKFSDLALPPELLLTKTVTDVEDASLWIDSQIELLRKHKQNLRERHNQSLPQARIPSEIFSQIFHRLTPPFSLYQIYSEPYSCKRWLNFTHVCRAWREIALNDPRLWTYPLFEKPLLAKEMITRARCSPLDINWSFGENEGSTDGSKQSYDLKQNSLLRNEIIVRVAREGNIRTLKLKMQPEERDAIHSSLSSQPHPDLKQLNLYVSGLDVDRFIGARFSSFPEILAPHIRRITLHNITHPFISSKQPLLSLISICLEADSPIRLVSLDTGLPVSAVVQLMESAPNLESLALTTVLRPMLSVEAPYKYHHPIEMAQLRSLNITDYTTAVCEILDCISAPKLRNAQIRCHQHPGGEIFDSELLTRKQVTHLFDRILTLVSVSPLFEPGSPEIELFGSEHTIHIQVSLSTALDLHIYDINATEIPIFLAQTRNLFCHGEDIVLSLNVEDGVILTDCPWTTYASMSSLGGLMAGGTWCAEELLNVLCQGTDRTEEIPFPQVTHLMFSGVYFSRGLLQKFVDTISSYVRRNTRLETVTLRYCELPSRSWHWLEELPSTIEFIRAMDHTYDGSDVEDTNVYYYTDESDSSNEDE